MKKIVFCDFDKTIVNENIFHKIMEEFNSSNWPILTKSWLNGQLTTEESLDKHISYLKCNENELKKFLDQFLINPYFQTWIKFCQKNNYEIYILSEGLDFYINYITKRHNINLKVFSHHLFFINDKAFSRYGGKDSSGGKCGSFKAQVFRRLTHNNTKTIVIGDDSSDFSISGMANFVFAKNSLLGFCKQNNIPHTKYDNFRDILRAMKAFDNDFIKYKNNKI